MARHRSDPLLRTVKTFDGKQYTVVRPYEYAERLDYHNREGAVKPRKLVRLILPGKVGMANVMRVLSTLPSKRQATAVIDTPTLRRDRGIVRDENGKYVGTVKPKIVKCADR